jgi:ribosomal protein S18 acetylase RimI-like enzyme
MSLQSMELESKMEPETSDESETTVRSATKADIDLLGMYGAELVSIHHGWDARRFIAGGPRTPTAYSSHLRGQLDKPDVLVLVAEIHGKVVGYAYAGLEGSDYMALRGPAGAIYDIFVEESHRRRGAGRALLTAVVGELGGRGATQIVLSTAHRNDDGQRLFASMGFEPTMVEMTLQL